MTHIREDSPSGSFQVCDPEPLNHAVLEVVQNAFQGGGAGTICWMIGFNHRSVLDLAAMKESAPVPGVEETRNGKWSKRQQQKNELRKTSAGWRREAKLGWRRVESMLLIG